MSIPSYGFRLRANVRLCHPDYHPDTWNPAWSVATILTGLLSFMLEKSPTLGSVETTEAEKRRLAAASHGTHFPRSLSNKYEMRQLP